MFDFGQNGTVESIENVPEQFRGLYQEAEDGAGFSLKDEPGIKGAVEAILSLNGTLKKARLEANGLRGRAVDLGALGEFGEDVEEITAGVRNKIEALEAQLKGGKQAKIDVDKAKADFAAAHVKDREALDKRITALVGQLYTEKVTNAALKAIGDDAIDPELVMPFLTKRVRPVEENGEFQVFVVDEGGDRRYSTTTGSAMTVAELVKEMQGQEKYGPLFKSKAPKGANTPTQGPGRIPVRVQGEEKKTPLQKIRDGLAARSASG